MDGYTDETYGEAFADVYDEWYEHVSDVDETVAALVRLASSHTDGSSGDVLELGVGTGRLAIPLAASLRGTGATVHGLDASTAMLDRLVANDPQRTVVAHTGDMVEAMPSGPFGVVFVAYNTLFALTSEDRQGACFAAVAARLAPGGSFVVEAFVPDDRRTTEPSPAGSVTVRSMTVDRVVLSVSRNDPHAQLMHGQYVDITASDGVRLRPWSIRYATPEQLDAMASAAGLTRVERWASFSGSPFDEDSTRHVSVYRSTA